MLRFKVDYTNEDNNMQLVDTLQLASYAAVTIPALTAIIVLLLYRDSLRTFVAMAAAFLGTSSP